LHGTTIEVNPFLAELIAAKVTPISPVELVEAFSLAVQRADSAPRRRLRDGFKHAPASLCEPGERGRFVFGSDVFNRVIALRHGIEAVEGPGHRRLLRVLLGSILVSVSNVVVNGKGRRYRGGWQQRRVVAADVDDLLAAAVTKAARDLAEYGTALKTPARVISGDCRTVLPTLDPSVDVAVFSPPYPNSFDYTDVYNLELWMLGYLSNPASNRELRRSTLRSHVQVQWDAPSSDVCVPSKILKRTLTRLSVVRDDLWDPRLVEMVRDYFVDMTTILGALKAVLRRRGHAFVVVGDSRYSGVRIDTASILAEIACAAGFTVVAQAPIRSMRSSAQHGGRRDLTEACIVLRS
jgi:hypothetical protein